MKREAPTVQISLRLPLPMVAAVERARAASGMTRAAALRELITLELVRRGQWPPEAVRK